MHTFKKSFCTKKKKFNINKSFPLYSLNVIKNGLARYILIDNPPLLDFPNISAVDSTEEGVDEEGSNGEGNATAEYTNENDGDENMTATEIQHAEQFFFRHREECTSKNKGNEPCTLDNAINISLGFAKMTQEERHNAVKCMML